MSRSLTFWQPMPTPHLFALAEAMVDQVERVRFVTLDALNPERAALGWSSAMSPRVEQAHAPDTAAVCGLVADFAGPDDIHVLPGLKPVRWLRPVQRALRPSAARIVVMAEAALPQSGWRAHAQHCRDRVLAAGWQRRAELVLAMGAIGVTHYRAIGFAPDQVREFGYFPALAEGRAYSAREAVQLAFAGALIPRKGLDLLLTALAHCGREDWHLRVVGDGPERAALQAQAFALGLAERIQWLGAIPAGAVPELLAAADCAVLPSRFDGWGAVTNEALGVGTPVLASDRCGSSAVLSQPELGGSFAAGDPAALAGALHRLLAQPRDRAAIRAWAHERLSPAAGARYLAQLLAGDRDVVAPWRLVAENGH